MIRRAQPLLAIALLGLTLTLSLPLAPVARGAAPCADPSGVCPNGGQVTFPSPPPAGPASAPCADPSGVCPNGGQVTFPSPPPAGPASAPCADPSGNCGGSATGVSPGVSSAGGLGISVDTDTAAVGDTVIVSGQGFAANGRGGQIYVNIVAPDGSVVDTRIADIQCAIAPDLPFYLYVVGCSSDASGATIVSDADGNFVAAIRIPRQAEQGSQMLCASSVFTSPVCTPITIQS